MSKRKTGSRLVSLLLAVLMLIAYMPLLGDAVYAEEISYTNVSTSYNGDEVGGYPNNYGPVISSNKTEYELGEDIYIKVENSGSATGGGWIGIYDSYDADPNITTKAWAYTGNSTVSDVTDYVIYGPNKNAGVTVNSELTGGTYYIIHMADDGRWAVLPITIKVEPSTLSVDKRVYKVNESINVSATSGYPNAWVGFYPYRGGDPLDNGDLAAHYTLADAGVETVDIVNDEAVIDKEKVKDLPDGRYKVILFTDGWAIDDSRGSMCIESFYVYDPDKLFTWYEEDGEWKAYATFTDQGPTEVDAVVSADTTDATCSAAGEKVYTASVNADAIDGAITGSFAAALKTAAPYTDTKTVEIPKKDHTPGDTVKENVVAPECGKAGSHDDVVYCTVCEAEISRTHVDDAALEHDYQEVADSAKAATCTEPGKEADKKCSRCDDVITGAEIAALGHKPKKVEAKEATTEAEGNIEYWTCETCGKFFSDAEGKTEITKEDTVIPKIEEDPTEDPAAASAAKTQTPAEIVDLPAVKISKPKAAKKKITVKWKKVSKKNQKKIQGVEIQVATDAGFTDIVKTANGSKKKVSKAVKGLKSKTKYYVRIRAYKNAADGKHVSAWKTKSVKVK